MQALTADKPSAKVNVVNAGSAFKLLGGDSFANRIGTTNAFNCTLSKVDNTARRCVGVMNSPIASIIIAVQID